jgi:hypothetical protein
MSDHRDAGKGPNKEEQAERESPRDTLSKFTVFPFL